MCWVPPMCQEHVLSHIILKTTHELGAVVSILTMQRQTRQYTPSHVSADYTQSSEVVWLQPLWSPWPACQVSLPLHHTCMYEVQLLSWENPHLERERPWDYRGKERSSAIASPIWTQPPANHWVQPREWPRAKPAEEPRSWAQLRLQNCEPITIWLLF